jgi:hypothetical protein
MQRADSGQVYFREVQRFTQWWVWLIVLGIAALMWYGFIEQLVFGRPFGDHPAPDWMLILFLALFGIGMPWLFIAAALRTEVRADALYVRFIPFHLGWIRIAPAEIRSAAAGSYNPLTDYGGWGIRYGRGGKAYNAKGNQGVLLELADGSTLMIGSQQAVELAAAIDELQKRQQEGGADA